MSAPSGGVKLAPGQVEAQRPSFSFKFSQPPSVVFLASMTAGYPTLVFLPDSCTVSPAHRMQHGMLRCMQPRRATASVAKRQHGPSGCDRQGTSSGRQHVLVGIANDRPSHERAAGGAKNQTPAAPAHYFLSKLRRSPCCFLNIIRAEPWFS